RGGERAAAAAPAREREGERLGAERARDDGRSERAVLAPRAVRAGRVLVVAAGLAARPGSGAAAAVERAAEGRREDERDREQDGEERAARDEAPPRRRHGRLRNHSPRAAARRRGILRKSRGAFARVPRH